MLFNDEQIRREVIAKLSTDHRIDASDIRVRVHSGVVKMSLDSGSATALSQVPIRVVYSMTDSVLGYRSVDGETVEIPSDASEVYARPGDDLSVTNPGTEEATIVFFDWFV